MRKRSEATLALKNVLEFINFWQLMIFISGDFTLFEGESREIFSFEEFFIVFLGGLEGYKGGKKVQVNQRDK